MKDVRTAAKYCEGDQLDHFCHNQEIRGQLSLNNTVPCTYQTKCKIRDPSPLDRPSSTRINQAGTAVTCHQEGVKASDSNSGTNLICTRKHMGMFEMNQSTSPFQLNDLVAVDGLGKKHFPFHKGPTEVDASLESSSCSLGVNREQISGKQTGSKTGRSHQDEQAKSSGHQIMPGTDVPKVLVQIKSRPSSQEVGLEAKRTTSGDFQETSHSRTNYYVLETHSTKSSNSELEILVNRKTVKHSSASDNLIEERVQTNIDILEMQSQKTVHSDTCRDNERCPSGPQKDSSAAHPDCREACEEVNEVYTSKMLTRTSSRGSDCYIPASCETEVFNRSELLRTKRTELETKRLHGDEALYKLSCRSNQNEVREWILDNQQHMPIQHNANDEEIEEKEVPTHIELGTPFSNEVSSPERGNKGSSTSEPSKSACPAERLLGDLRVWLTTKIRMDSGFGDEAKSSENQEQINAESHASQAPPGNEVLRKSASGEILESEELDRLTEKQQRDNTAAGQHVSGQEAQYKQSKSSSTSQILASEPIDSLKRTGILGGGASSDKSFSNPIKQTLAVKNTQEVSNSIEPPYWTECQQDQGQSEDEDSGEGSRVQSEQGSYNPVD